MRDETLTEFVLRLKGHQVSVVARNGDLAVSCPAGRMPEYLLAEIRARKRELIGFLNRRPIETQIAIKSVDTQLDYEVSPAQRRIWMFDQIDVARRAYNVPGAYLLTGELDLAALQESLNALIARHEILRTTFISRDGEIRQRIHDKFTFDIPKVELAAAERSQQAIAELICESLGICFDLTALPLFSFRLIRVAERSTLVVFNSHHIICDGRSLALLTEELLSRFLRRDAGSPKAPGQMSQYKDYAVWFNRLLESGALNYQRDYWILKLGGETQSLQLPYDYSRPASLNRRSRILLVELTREESGSFRELAANRSCSLFNALLTFVLLVLRHITGHKDIRIGTPVIGRPHAELRDQIGCHINLVVLRNRLEDSVSIETLMAAVQAVTTEAFTHQLYPFDLLVGELAERRILNRNPLFDVLVTLQDDRPLSELSGLGLTPYPIQGGVGRYDLTFGFEWSDSRVRLNIEYLEELFTEATAERIGKLFVKLVRSGLDSPQATVADLTAGTEPTKSMPANVTSKLPINTPIRASFPTSEVKNLLLEILRNVLRTPNLDVADNYFEHGGDSVKAMQTIARLSRSGVVLEISDFFVYPTIRELSSRVRPMRSIASAGHHALPTVIGTGTLDSVLATHPSWLGQVERAAFLSPMQEGILFHTIDRKEPLAYQAQTTLALEGRISPSVFSMVWERLVERHDMLRTRIVPVSAERPVQITLSPACAGVDVLHRDLRNLSVDEQERVFSQARLDDRKNSFKLTDAPLVRVYLFQLGETRFQVLMSHHQIILDGWSIGALFIEFARIYDALAESRPIRLPTVGSFASYIDWLETNTTETQRQYWQHYLADLRSPTEFPFKRPHSSSSMGKVFLDLDHQLNARLVSLSRERMVTLSTVLQALWGILLGKYNETDDVVFGTVVSVRPAELEGIEHALGVYMNTIPVRLRSFANLTFVQLLDTVRTQTLQSWAHAHFPLVEILKTTPHRDRLFAHLLIVQNYPMGDEVQGQEQKIESKVVDVVESAGYDLLVEVRLGGTVRITFEYNEGRYERRNVEELAEHFLALTRSAAAQPGQPISGLSLLEGEVERRLRERVEEDQAMFSRIGSFDFE